MINKLFIIKISTLFVLAFIVGGFVIPNTNTALGQAPALNTTQGGTGTSSPSGILYGDGSLRLKTVSFGSNLTFVGGLLSATGGSGGGTMSTTTSQVAGQLVNYPNNFTDILAVGSNSTTTAEFYFDPNTVTFGIQGWNMGTTTAIVCKNSNQCKYTSVQTALNDGWTSLYVKNGVYSEQITLQNAKTIIQGESLNAIIQCNGVTQSPCVDTNSLDEIKLRDFTIRETNGVLSGVGLDISNSAVGRFDNLRINNFSTSTTAIDSNSNTFYNVFEKLYAYRPRSCVEFSGTQANKNDINSLRCIPMTVGGQGVYVSDARGLTFNAPNIEATSTTGLTTGMFIDGTSREITVINPWFEAHGTGLNIASGANRVQVIGGSITSNTTDVSDNGTNTTFIGTSDTGVLLNQLAPITITNTTASSTFANGLNLTGGCFAIGGTCIGGAGGSGTVGSGTAGQVPFYQSNGTTLTATSTLFISTGGFVGINNASPATELDITGTGGTTVLRISAPTFQTAGINFMPTGGATAKAWSIQTDHGGDFDIINNSTGLFTISGNVDGGGTSYVGISSTTPGSNLAIGTSTSNFINLSVNSTSTYARGINLRSGCFAINDVCISGGGGGSVTMSGAFDYITLVGQDIVRGAIDLATDVTGTLAVANGGTGITSFGAGIATWLGTPSSSNFFSAITGETGSGAVVGGTSPTISGLTGTGAYNLSGATVKINDYRKFTWPPTYATSTTATTTVRLGYAMVSELFNFSTCKVTSSTGGYRFTDGTNHANYFPATSSPSRFTYTTNNSFVADEEILLEVGPMTNAQLTCGVDVTVNN